MTINLQKIETEEYLAELNAEAEEKAITLNSQQAHSYTAQGAAMMERNRIVQALQDTPLNTSVEEAILIIRDLPQTRFHVE